jgi:hypothetical protein
MVAFDPNPPGLVGCNIFREGWHCWHNGLPFDGLLRGLRRAALSDRRSSALACSDGVAHHPAFIVGAVVVPAGVAGPTGDATVQRLKPQGQVFAEVNDVVDDQIAGVAA